jgi:CDP-6-deoxy-D-xylo-4-hexulose-3-dehydrase
MDLTKLEAAIGPKTRAIVIIHTYGNPMDMDAVTDICKRHNLVLIEDNCESMGATFKGKYAGTFGVAGSMSTYFSHHITNMEGGLIVTDDHSLLEAMRLQRAHGWSREADGHAAYMAKYPNIDPRFIFVDTGYNLRPTEVQSAMGMIQIEKLGAINAARREAAHYLNSRFAEWGDLFQTVQETKGGESVWFGYCVQLKPAAGFTVKDIRSFLESKGIETRPVIAGNMTRHPVLQGRNYRLADDMTSANSVMDNGFAMPCHHDVKGAAATYMADCVAEFVAQVKTRKAA